MTLESKLAAARERLAEATCAQQKDWEMAFKHGFDHGLKMGKLVGMVKAVEELRGVLERDLSDEEIDGIKNEFETLLRKELGE